MLAAAYHALLELSTIVSHDLSNPEPLQLHSCVKVFADHLICEEVPNSSLQMCVASTYLHDIVYQVALALELASESGYENLPPIVQ